MAAGARTANPATHTEKARSKAGLFQFAKRDAGDVTPLCGARLVISLAKERPLSEHAGHHFVVISAA
jgi:hypothetical protein